MSIETMTKLATVTVGSGGSATMEFTNIPQTYTDLIVKFTNRADSGNYSFRFNGDSGNNYDTRLLRADGSGVDGFGSELGRSNIYFQSGSNSATTTSNTFGNCEIYISNYSGNTYKPVSVDGVGETNGANVFSTIVAATWLNTSAITSIRISADGGTFVQNCTATLYGIRNMARAAGNSIKATGGNISFDGTYVVHTFNTSGTFTPTVALPDVDYLVVAGGGGGGRYKAGGGGAGGLRSTVTATGGGGSLESALSLIANTPYTVTIGAGGAGGTNGAQPSATGTNGSNSVFSTITSTGGGAGSGAFGGGSGAGSAAGNGGSGGGVGGDVNFTFWNTGGTGTANQGFAGGTSSSGNEAGGGGGAGEAGNTDGQGEGGDGVAVSISGSSVTYAGGGGGGSNSTTRNGGTGGGGNGGFNSAATAGTANTGGGGGGGAGDNFTSDYTGKAGGSGVVIIRYKA